MAGTWDVVIDAGQGDVDDGGTATITQQGSTISLEGNIAVDATWRSNIGVATNDGYVLFGYSVGLIKGDGDKGWAIGHVDKSDPEVLMLRYFDLEGFSPDVGHITLTRVGLPLRK